MDIRLFLLYTLFLCVIGNSGHADPIKPLFKLAGQSGLPFNENINGRTCSKSGWKNDQHHMELNSNYGYHMGEDWNGICGEDTDEDAPLLAVADGKVVYVDLKDTKVRAIKFIYVIPFLTRMHQTIF